MAREDMFFPLTIKYPCKYWQIVTVVWNGFYSQFETFWEGSGRQSSSRTAEDNPQDKDRRLDATGQRGG